MFPKTLYAILSDESNSDSIAWLPHGRAFVIRNRFKLVRHVLPRYFGGHRIQFSSLVRKLQRWKFVRLLHRPPNNDSNSSNIGLNDVVFCHPQFRRDDARLEEMTPKHGTRIPQCKSSSSTMEQQQVVSNDTDNSEGNVGAVVSTAVVVKNTYPTTATRQSASCGGGLKPLKKRPVDASLFRIDRNPTPLPTLSKPPSILVSNNKTRSNEKPRLLSIIDNDDDDDDDTCCVMAIERQGLLHKKQAADAQRTKQLMCYKKKEALLTLLLQDELGRERTKAKQHFLEHYYCGGLVATTIPTRRRTTTIGQTRCCRRPSCRRRPCSTSITLVHSVRNVRTLFPSRARTTEG